MNTNLVLFTVIFLAIVIVLVIVSKVQAEKRTQALKNEARALGFEFDENEDSDSPGGSGYRGALFNRGSNRRLENMMIGNFAGFDTSLFDYSFTTGGGKSQHTWNQTVMTFSQALSLPLFAMRPENFVDRIGDAFTHKDIDFDSNPDFSHRYLLRGEDEEQVRALFTPALLAFLESIVPKEKWHIEGDGKKLIFYRSDVMVSPEEIHAVLEKTSTMAKTFLSCCGRSVLSASGDRPR